MKSESVIPTTKAVALIGNPNTGKSSLFNALCGMSARVGNYPGVTVEEKVGKLLGAEPVVDVIDLPGTYSLAARSDDEAVAVNILSGTMKGYRKPDCVVVIVDATNIERNLYLFSQVVELGLPTILVLNMWDRIDSAGVKFDFAEFSKRVGVPVVCTSAHKRTGIDELKAEIKHQLSSERTLSSVVPTRASDSFPEDCCAELKQLEQWLEEQQIELPRFQAERLLIDVDGHFSKLIDKSKLNVVQEYVDQARQRLAAKGIRVAMVETKTRYGWIKKSLDGVLHRTPVVTHSFSDSIDRWLTHRWFGMFFFVLVMFLVFQSITRLSAWPMEQIEWLQSQLGTLIESWLSPGIMRSLIVDGVLAGVGAVVMFLPQIAILFFFIAVLEDCGYMARAAFVMDKLMSSVGLSGKSFLPLMSSFACAVPGIMATRTIENRRDRMVTMLVAPLMSCSARLPVYVLMVSAFVPATYYAGGWISTQGTVLFLMQSLGAVVAVPVAWLLKKFMFPGAPATFLMELHSYKWPSMRVLLHRVWERVVAFLYRAGSLIVCTTILVWAAGYFPGDHTQLDQITDEREQLQRSFVQFQSRSEDPNSPPLTDSEKQWASQTEVTLQQKDEKILELRSQLLERSFLGIAGHSIEPIVRPLGWDWKIAVAVIASFPAREVIIATLGTIYSLSGDDVEQGDGLKAQMRSATNADGELVFNIATALSVMVFFALCAQCSATLMTIRRETNSWRWPIFSFAYMTFMAYLGAWATYQVVHWWIS